MRLFWLISWPYVRTHLPRYGLLVAGVALGVAVAVALQGGASSVLAEFRETVERMSGSCQLQVMAGEAGVPEAFLERIQGLKEVRAATPVIEALAEIEGVADSRLLIVALDMTGDAQMRPWIRPGGGRRIDLDPITFIAQPDSVLLSRSFALRRGWRIGSRFGLKTMAGLKTLTVRGLMSDADVDKIYGGNVAVMDVYGAQAIFGRGRSVDRIDIALAEGASLDAARRAVWSVTGPGYSVEPPAARTEQFEDLLEAYRVLQAMACFFATALGISMIDVSFRLAVTQRRAEIGILRSLGATRGQVQRIFLMEGLATGVLGSGAGLLLGIQSFNLAARAAGGVFRNTLGGLANRTYEFQLSAGTIAIALLAGVGISMVASWLPSREAARGDPLEALRPIYFQQRLQAWRPGHLLAAGLLGAAAILGALQQGSSVLFYSSMGLLFVAIVLVVPSVALVLVRLLRPLVVAVFRLEGELALDSLVRRPRRTATTIVILLLVFSLAVLVGGIRRSTRLTLSEWVESAFHSDLLLSASANLASQSFRFPSEFEGKLRSVAGVAAVQPLRSVRLPYRGKLVLTIAADYGFSCGKALRGVVSGDWAGMCAQLAAGRAVVISENLAHRERLQRGSVFELDSPAGRLSLPVAGIVRDHSDKAGVVFLERSIYQGRWSDTSVDKFRIDVDPGRSPQQVAQAIRTALGDQYPASILTKEEAREYVLRPPGRRISPVEIQLIVSILVAALALMNMAAISVAERTREFALLRSLGGYRRVLRKTLLVEMLATGAISLLLGVATGAALLVYLLQAVERYVAGVRLSYAFPWGVAAGLLAVVAAAGTLAVLSAVPALGRIPLSVALDSE